MGPTRDKVDVFQRFLDVEALGAALLRTAPRRVVPSFANIDPLAAFVPSPSSRQVQRNVSSSFVRYPSPYSAIAHDSVQVYRRHVALASVDPALAAADPALRPYFDYVGASGAVLDGLTRGN